MQHLILGFLTSRTIIFNLIMLAFATAKTKGWIANVPPEGVVNQFIDLVLQNVPELWAGGNIILRYLTTKPVGEKK